MRHSPIRPLDALFSRAPPLHVRLIKMDLQGYECRALDGMRRLLRRRAVQGIRTEVSVPHLEAQGCSAGGMHDRVDELFGRVPRPPPGDSAWTYELATTSSWVAARGRKPLRHAIGVGQNPP